MAWIELHQSLPTHKKTLAAADALDMAPAHFVGHLISFWLWALDNAPDGDLGSISPRMIAHASQWTGDPQAYLNALTGAGFLDAEGDALCIHDWRDYAGKLIDRRAADRQRSKERRSATKDTGDHKETAGRPADIQRTSSGRPADVQQTSVGTVPNRTVPNSTVPNQGQGQEKPRARKIKDDPTAPKKTAFADFVSMTNAEHTALVAKLGEAGAKRCIEILDNYKGATGKTYASDYRAILNWVVSRYAEERRKEPKSAERDYDDEDDFIALMRKAAEAKEGGA